MSRHEFFQACDADGEHQHLAGIASWRAFSARWRARQGLPLLHAMDVQYLTPGDFCNGKGRPLAPAEQRRRFRAYVEAAIAEEAARRAPAPLRRRPGLQSADLAFVRSSLPAVDTFRPEIEYGRPDLPPWDEANVSPRRPYGIPVVGHDGSAAQAYWLDPALAPGTDEEW